MSVSEIHVAAPPERVFDVLRDRTLYGEWVVGTASTTPDEGEWPEPGSALRYTVAGPIPLSDRTVVLAADEPRRLELHTRAGHLPDGRIVLEVRPEGSGSRVRMEERPAHLLFHLLAGPVGHWVLARRNDIALHRLRRLTEAGAGAEVGSV